MHKMLFIDIDKCTGCRMCMMACSLNKTKTFNPVRSRISIIRIEEDGINLPVVCKHCEKPVCMAVCPIEAISKDKETGIVSIDYNTCIGCRTCLEECPLGGPSFDPIQDAVILCDLCGGKPECAAVCPTGAVQYLTTDRSAAAKRRGVVERLSKIEPRSN